MPRKRKGGNNKWRHVKGSKKIKKMVKTETSPVPLERLASHSSSFGDVGQNEEQNRQPTRELFSQIVRGTRSQEDERYGPISNNKQCTANAAVSIAYGTWIPYNEWNSTIIDNILDHGDALYLKSVRTRNLQVSSPYLLVNEVYPNFIIDNNSFTLEILETETVAGHIVGRIIESEIDVPLAEGLPRVFQNFQSAIFTSSVKSIALSKFSDGFYLFDSHSRSATGEYTEVDGKACLLKFTNLDLLTRFLLRTYNNSEEYNLVPIQVQRRTATTSVRNISEVTNENRQNDFQQTANLHYLGAMDRLCPNCNALFFPNENYICCNKGNIQIPTNAVYPDLLKALIMDNHPESRHFLKNIRKFNNLLALGSTWLKQRTDLGCGAPVIVVSGQIYHTVDNIDSSNPSLGSLYFVDSGEATCRRNNAEWNKKKLNENLLKQLDALLRNTNPFAKLYCSLGQIVKEYQRANNSSAVQEFGLYFHNKPGTDRKVNAAPSTSDEIGAIFQSVDGNVPPPGTIRVQLVSDPSNTTTHHDIPRMSPIADTLCYPLIFPNGELGWMTGLLKSRGGKRISMREFECYRLMVRVNEYNPILFCGKLSQQFIVDKYVQIEGDRLYYLRINQEKLRAENYVGLADYVARKNMEQGNEERIGRFVILPSTFTGGTRFMIQNYQDAMAIVARFGRPSLFVTFTCNPNWREIKENMLGKLLNPQDRPELIARVFDLKMREFFRDVKEKKIFGEVIAYVYVIEFQKRGLPHMHCLLFLSDKDKLRNPDDVDKLICAELPEENTRLFDIVLSTMIHGPCGSRNPRSPCMLDGQCTKHYPKSFVAETSINRAWPEYRRRNDDRTVAFTRNNIVSMIDNRDVVPYNPYLSLKYECHINVEVVTSVGSVKYVFKYINKGHDAATVAIREECDHDEIKAFIDSRYVSSGEAAWKILDFSIQGKSHTIYRLPVHLPGERVVYFEEGQEEIALQRSTVSLLEAYFQLNVSDPGARAFTYTQIPLHYSFNETQKCWVRRVRNRKVIPRMYTICPKYVEKFHLRILLLHVPGAKSFEDLRTHNRVTYATFREAVQARGLITTDQEWIKTLEHAALVEMPGCMRKLFAYMLCYCEIRDPLNLWNTFKRSMYEDYVRRGHSEERSENFALCRIDSTLRFLGRRLQDFNLPEPVLDADNVDDQDADTIPDNSDPATLNSEQRDVFDRVIAAVQSTTIEERLFFLQGNGGCGKTYLYNVIIDYCETHNLPSIAVAFTGIAALLLRNGRTVHSTFKLPLDVNENSRSSITAQSEEAERLRSLKLIIWDEVTMASYHVVNAVDELLRDVCKNQIPFGGKCILLGGDVKQLLPVAAGRVRQVELFFTNCKSWNNFKVLTLNTNMRVHATEVDFMRWLDDLGQGKKNLSILISDSICDDFTHLPKRCLTMNVVEDIYGELETLTREQLATRAILCPRNDHCNYLNNRVIDMFPGDVIVSRSVDSIASGDENEIANFPEEYLNSITPSGMPLHELKLKVGIPIILLRNLCLEDGLINGTRLIVLAVSDVLLTAEIITGRFAGRKTLIPKVDLTSADQSMPFTLKRHQFPVKVCFALTINKAQGQTFDKVGIYLGSPVFSHGQLYVAFSRARSWDAVKVEVARTRDQGKLMCSSNKIFTKNIVYKNILNCIRNQL